MRTHARTHTNTHTFIQAISIVPLLVHCYSKALPTQRRYGMVSAGLAQGPYVAVCREGFEPATLRTKGVEYTNEAPRPTNTLICYVYN